MSDLIPRHLLLALAQAQRAFERRDLTAFGTINENLQPVMDAALGWIRKAMQDRDDTLIRLGKLVETDAARLAEVEAIRAERDALRANFKAAVARADEAEAMLDALHERIATADVPWRLPGCECPVDSKPADRCDSRWTRCNPRLSYQRAVKAAEGT